MQKKLLGFLLIIGGISSLAGGIFNIKGLLGGSVTHSNKYYSNTLKRLLGIIAGIAFVIAGVYMLANEN